MYHSFIIHLSADVAPIFLQVRSKGREVKLLSFCCVAEKCLVSRPFFQKHVCSVVSDSLHPHGMQPARLLCPWNSPGKNTRVGYHSLVQEIFPTQGSNLHLLHLLPWQADSLPLSHLGSPSTSNCFFSRSLNSKAAIDLFSKRHLISQP